MPFEFLSELPPVGTRHGASREIAAELRTAPGFWAKVRTSVTRQAVDADARVVRNGSIEAFEPAGSFEAAVRKNDGGTFDLYARFVGEAS